MLKIRIGDTDMKANPASVNLDTGICTINPKVWINLTETEKQLILLHEYGHIKLNSTTDEIGSDKFAINSFAGSTPLSLRKSVEAFINILSTAGVDEKRQIEILKSALETDYEKFKNEKSLKILKKLNDTRQANTVGSVLSGVAAGTSLVTLGITFLLGKQNDWAKSGKTGAQTQIREDILKAGTQVFVGGLLEQYASSGEAYINNILSDKNRVYEQVHSKLYNQGVWKDNNIFTNNYSKVDKFYKNYPWAKGIIDKEVLLQQTKMRALFASMGYGDPNKKTNYTWILYALAGVLVVYVIYKYVI